MHTVLYYIICIDSMGTLWQLLIRVLFMKNCNRLLQLPRSEASIKGEEKVNEHGLQPQGGTNGTSGRMGSGYSGNRQDPLAAG